MDDHDGVEEDRAGLDLVRLAGQRLDQRLGRRDHVGRPIDATHAAPSRSAHQRLEDPRRHDHLGAPASLRASPQALDVDGDPLGPERKGSRRSNDEHLAPLCLRVHDGCLVVG